MTVLDNFLEHINVLFTKITDKGVDSFSPVFSGWDSCSIVVLQVSVFWILNSGHSVLCLLR